MIVVRSARGLPDLEPDVGRRVSPDPPLHAMPEDTRDGLFELIDVNNAGCGVLHAGPPLFAQRTAGEQVDTPPSRPGDDGLDPPRRVACHHRTTQVPALQAADREEGRPQRDGHHVVHGEQPPDLQLRIPAQLFQYAPCTGPAERGRTCPMDELRGALGPSGPRVQRGSVRLAGDPAKERIRATSWRSVSGPSVFSTSIRLMRPWLSSSSRTCSAKCSTTSPSPTNSRSS